ncbi:alpha-N-acetyl-neuraminyl-2,3-beta-galactosyl-1,3-N-acetyl-galactosaminide alpha-2,6-sialyltransferase-like isoform X1 [Diadema antillarum]|uniref:alpha-N-acetyl-neuraminyl-2,3-beta-galactosyl-1, 3-N-acetyl-galactosaminide alpha-2,6-sialyltransferase-like isoform X1 n=1 Tax=Diadema antillarum TaxID=105358 RepID=UPI003A874A0B
MGIDEDFKKESASLLRKTKACLKRCAAALFHLLFYCVIISVGFTVYQWVWTAMLLKMPPGGNPCRNRDECTRRGPRKDGAAVSIKATTTSLRAVTVKGMSLEPKNWNGQGYKSVSRNMALRHCKQCALVTSSGHLSGRRAGKEIDKAECVIRMNAAPTLNYEQDVGSRTTFRVIGHRNFPRMFDTQEERQLYFVNRTTRSEAIVVLWLYSVNVKKNPELILSRKYAKQYKNVSFYLTQEEVMKRNVKLFYQELGISEPKGKLWMSTGWVAMLFALEVCDSTDVYGMIYDDYCKEHPKDTTYYHYFDKVKRECAYYKRSEKKLTSGHKFMTEKVAFARWASLYNIRFHLPSWANHSYDPNVRKETVFQKQYLLHQEKLRNKTEEDKSSGEVVRTFGDEDQGS